MSDKTLVVHSPATKGILNILVGYKNQQVNEMDDEEYEKLCKKEALQIIEAFREYCGITFFAIIAEKFSEEKDT